MRPKALLLATAILGCAGQTPSLDLTEFPVGEPSDCSHSLESTIDATDTVIVIDATFSTSAPSGSDLNRNGRVGRTTPASIVTWTIDDVGDSIFAAELVATRSLVEILAGPRNRFAIAAFYAEGSAFENWPTVVGRIVSPLTSDVRSLADALADLSRQGPGGNVTSFTSGMTVGLDALSGASEQAGARKIALLVSDTPGPTPYGERSMKDAALRAIDEGVVFHTFGLGDAASRTPPFALSQIAGATGGSYQSVSDAAMLYCHFLSILSR